MHLFLILLSSLVIVACGKPASEPPEGASLYLAEVEGGFYRSTLKPLNKKFNDKISGSSVVRLKENQFYARVRVEEGQESLLHIQHIHTGSKCPDMTADLNQDGVIDFKEVVATSGKVLVPLDSDLESQESSWDYPISSQKGKYVFSYSVGLNKMLLNMMNAPDTHPILKKLESGEGLNIGSRVLVIYGIDEKVWLPETFQGMDDYPLNFAVPIACGVFTPAEDTLI